MLFNELIRKCTGNISLKYQFFRLKTSKVYTLYIIFILFKEQKFLTIDRS